MSWTHWRKFGNGGGDPARPDNPFHYTQDSGKDLEAGDFVVIVFRVEERASTAGDVMLRYLPRLGKDEYARRAIAAIFLRRPKSRFVKRFWNALLACL